MGPRVYPKVLARLAEGQTIRLVGRAAETLLMLVEKGSHRRSGLRFCWRATLPSRGIRP